MAKVSKAEYEKAKAAVEKAYTSDSIKAYSDAYNSAKASGSTTKDAYNSASGLLVKNSSGGSSSGGTSSGGVSGNSTSGGDVYGDKSGNATATGPMDFSNYTGDKTLSGTNAVFGENAKKKEQTTPGFLTSRNDTIAYEIYNNRKNNTGIQDVEQYLSQYDDYKDYDITAKRNTKRAIEARMAEIDKENGVTDNGVTNMFDGYKAGDGLTAEQIDEKNAQAREGYYRNPDGSYYEIHGYQALCDAGYKNLLDGMSEEDKKYVSNLWDKGMQETIKAYLDNKRQDKQLRERQDINEDLYNINRESSLIQSAQTLRQARESFDNLKQNWQYLGNMGMPGTSATKIQAIGDAISEAETTLNEIQKLTKLKLDAQEKEWEGQVLQYTQQIQNLQYDLDWKVSKEIQGLLGEFTTAELEGKLDTIDGITAFKKELLDKLNNNLSGITSASLQQMQYINQEYQDIADKMYQYQQNANTVNQEMSAVKGFYVDGNGNPIFNAKGETIQVPQSAPMDPIYDKETGKLITFAYDENGQIVAQVQDILGGGSGGTQSAIISLLEQGASVQDILKMYPNVDLKTVQALAEVVKPIGGGINYSDYTWKGASYTPVSRDAAKSAALKTAVSGTGGWCGAYVNKYLQSLGFAPSFIKDSLQSKLDIINTEDGYTPQVGDVVVFDYNHITPETGENNGHVGIVVGFRNGKMIVRDSNFDGDRQIKNREVSLDNKAIQGYFNPTKSINSYNNEVKSAVYEAQGLNSKGFRDNDTANYNNYLKKGDSAFTNADKERIAKSYGSYEAFQDAATAYQQNLDNQVSDVSIDLLKTLYKIKKMDSTDYWMAKNEPEWAMKRGLGSGGDWRTEIDHVIANTTLEKLVNMKSQGATFGALSEGELDMLNSSANKLNYTSSYSKFMENVDDMITGIEGSMDMRGYDYSKLKNEGGSTTTTTNNEPKPGGNVT